MGRSQSESTITRNDLDLIDEVKRARFAMYFPKVFAYAHSWTNDDARSREIVIEAFSRAFNRRSELADEDFPVVLFGVTRDLRAGTRKGTDTVNGGLSDPEREVIALLFDAQLTKMQVGSLLKMPEESVVSTLVNGLRKLKRAVARDDKPSLQQL